MGSTIAAECCQQEDLDKCCQQKDVADPWDYLAEDEACVQKVVVVAALPVLSAQPCELPPPPEDLFVLDEFQAQEKRAEPEQTEPEVEEGKGVVPRASVLRRNSVRRRTSIHRRASAFSRNTSSSSGTPKSLLPEPGAGPGPAPAPAMRRSNTDQDLTLHFKAKPNLVARSNTLVDSSVGDAPSLTAKEVVAAAAAAKAVKAPEPYLEETFTLETFYELESKVLGKGSFGTVRQARVRATKAVRAIKTLSLQKINMKRNRLMREIEIMKALDHPGVVMLFDTFQDKDHIHMVLELCQGGDLQQYMARIGLFNEAETAFAMWQLFRAVRYLHHQHVCHRDLKEQNIMLASKNTQQLHQATLKIADFGLSIRFQPKQVLTSNVGTLTHMAPEVLGRSYDARCDIWSCGVIMFRCLSGELPFESEQDVRKGKYRMAGQAWWNVSPEAFALVRQLLSPRKARISTEDFLSSDWLMNTLPHLNEPFFPTLHQQLKHYRSLNFLRRSVLRMIVRMLDDSVLAQVRSLFMSLDSESIGVVSSLDVAEYLQRHKLLSKREADIMEAEDEEAGYSDFMAATIGANFMLDDAVLKSIFSFFDKNGDEGISLTELIDGVAKLVGGADKAELTAAFNAADVDSDQHVSFKEFSLMMQWEAVSPRKKVSRFIR